MAAGLLFVWFLSVLAVGVDMKFKSKEGFRCSLCPPEWTWNEGSCCTYVDIDKDWADAEKFCGLFGGNLASLHSKEQCKVVRGLIHKGAHSDKQSWIGGNDVIQEGTWFWGDGSKLEKVNWCHGEPDNQSGKQHCMTINKNGMDCFSDEECDHKHPFVCCTKAKPRPSMSQC